MYVYMYVGMDGWIDGWILTVDSLPIRGLNQTLPTLTGEGTVVPTHMRLTPL